MDYGKVLQGKTIEEHYRKSHRKSATASTSSVSETTNSKACQEEDGTRHGSVVVQDLDQSLKTSSPMQNDSGVEEDEDPFTSTSIKSDSDRWFSDGNSQNDDEETFYTALSVQCLHHLDDEEDLEFTEHNEECRRFMSDIVDRLYKENAHLSSDEKATFLKWCKGDNGRGWFAYYVDNKRAECKRVSEKSFNLLVSYFTLVLLECKDIGDFYPAKLLLQMCFTFYHEYTLRRAKYREYLYEAMRSHPIWNQLGFWNATFLHAVHKERAYRSPVPIAVWTQLSTDERQDLELCDRNIAFGQLGALTMNMIKLGLSIDFVQEFAEKMTIISNLDEEQTKMLEENIRNLSKNGI